MFGKPFLTLYNGSPLLTEDPAACYYGINNANIYLEEQVR